ncbi:MAG TPA: DegT/DnrJ/EryC1/StrS family aminotransferase [Thermoanaerobaculia bacterium]|nr:DegT/DnrJ/EryC1/StrS family aminotransferase [Thermoanaerobaculia bacterium]
MEISAPPPAMTMIPVFAPWLPDSAKRYVLDCVESGWVSSLGRYVPRFEEELARFCEARHAVATANGTAALHLALAVLGIGPGDEVLVPDLTFVATASAVRYTGATPVLVDVDRGTWGIGAEEARRKLTPRTRAIIAVHLYGQPVDLGPLLDLAGEHGLDLIEDAAEAHGARYRGRRVGSLGRIGAFSFYGNKIFTTGEGGAVVTGDPELARRAAFLRDHAMDPERRYYHPEIGFNYRMTNIQAALGCSQLEHATEILRRREAIARAYDAGLAGIPGLAWPAPAPGAESVCWMYSVLVEPAFGRDRDEVCAGLHARGIDSRPFFVPLHELPPLRAAGPFPVATMLSRQGINLPSGTGLTPEEIAAVCRALRELAKPAT